MSFITDYLRNAKNKNLFLNYVWNEYRRYKEKRRFEKISDEQAILNLYTERFGRTPDLNNPESFTEKMQWLKLYYRDPLMAQCADKYAVREYIETCGYKEILNPLIAVFDSVDEIDYSKFPDKFVLKGTHGSGWIVLCKDKAKLPVKKYNRIMKSWMKQNIYYSGREWVYDKIPHRIICEKYIEASEPDGDLRDYKIFCFSGEPKCIQVDGQRFSNHQRAYYDLAWNKLPFQYGNYGKDYEAGCPDSLNKMLEIARKLSEPFPFARVDLYNVDNKIIFGEITFFPDAGFAKFDPPEMDLILGKILKLPIKQKKQSE